MKMKTFGTHEKCIPFCLKVFSAETSWNPCSAFPRGEELHVSTPARPRRPVTGPSSGRRTCPGPEPEPVEDPEAKQKLFLEAALGPLDGPPEAFAPAGNRNTGGGGETGPGGGGVRKEGRAVRLGFKEKRVAPRLSGEKLGQSLKSKPVGRQSRFLTASEW